jgi:hypothetical protein
MGPSGGTSIAPEPAAGTPYASMTTVRDKPPATVRDKPPATVRLTWR